MNSKLSITLFVGLFITASAQAWERQEVTPKGEEVTVETTKGEKLTGRWIHKGKYFRAKDGREVHFKGIKKKEAEETAAPVVKKAKKVKAAPTTAPAAAE